MLSTGSIEEAKHLAAETPYNVYMQFAYQALFTTLLILIAFASALGLTAVLIYAFVLYSRLRKREKISLEMVTIEVRLPKDNEIKVDAAEAMFASFSSIGTSGFFSFMDVSDMIAFEIVGKKSDIRFYISAPGSIIDLIEKVVYSYYPASDIKKVDEPNIFNENGKVAYGSLVARSGAYMPIKTYKDLPSDTMNALTSSISRMDDDEGAMIQILIRPSHDGWKEAGKSYVSSTKKDESNPEKASFKMDSKLLEKIDEKTSKSGFETSIRLVVSARTQQAADVHMRNIKNAFEQFSSSANGLTGAKVLFKGGFMMNFIYKFFPLMELWQWRTSSIMTPDELASIFHFPNKMVETPHIEWLKAKNAPVASEVPTTGGTFIGQGYYRGVRRPVHMSMTDRLRHSYIIGKTGTGKSYLLQDMIRQDIATGNGVCIIDPHGELIEDVMKFIPPERADQVIYFDPADTDRPMGLNLLEAHTEEQKQFITSAIINLMYKLYDPQRTGIIGPRFEHAVRNAMLTVMADEGATFVEVIRILTDQSYVKELLPKVKDPMVRRYWTDQIAQTSDFHKSEVLDYIVSKFGRFVTNTLMRNIIGQSKSSFDFREVMDEGKILLINLSKGRLGEENSNFLGLTLIPKLLVAAMSRQDIAEEKRRDFFLYVDEFQNFATPDFATILSEARKYKLALTVANQFIGQIDEEVKNAIFGNVGTMMAFRMGVTDASYMQREFQPIFGESDLINIEKYHIYMKTIVNNEPVPPFSVDLTKDVSAINAQANPKIAKAIIQLSRLKYGRPRELVEAEIATRAKL